jgi:hypothetical protein
VGWPALALLAAALPPADRHAALASAAGTLFEAAPFVLAAEVLPRRLGPALESAGCGCGRRGVPGATSLPATALCWLAFGPAVALARVTVAAPLWVARRGAGRGWPERTPSPPDPFRELAGLGAFAFAASLAAQWLGAAAPALHGAWLALAALGGAALGALVPCATAGVALAAGLTHANPAVAAGILCTAGLARLRIPGAELRGDRRTPVPAAFASVALAGALAALACRGPAGLVNPRLLPLDAAAAVLALAGTFRRRTASHAAPALGLVLVAILGAGYAVPSSVATETTLDGAFPAQAVSFTGQAYAQADGATVQRFAIACCRLDASPVAIRLTRRLAVPRGTWVALQGRFVRDGRGLAVRTSAWRRVPAPADPFVYR